MTSETTHLVISKEVCRHILLRAEARFSRNVDQWTNEKPVEKKLTNKRREKNGLTNEKPVKQLSLDIYGGVWSPS